MSIPVMSLLPGSEELALTFVEIEANKRTLLFKLKSIQQKICCPKCQQQSKRVHSHYIRTLADLPWGDLQVSLQIEVRRFFCQAPECPQKIFTERIEATADPWARRTQRLAETQAKLGVVLGGSGGEYLSQQLHLPVSLETLLRLIRRMKMKEEPTPRVLGVDDWAKRKGHSYGTILVDMESGRVIDLLPERSAKILATWLQQHPGVEIISRDRAGDYAQGARQGAPEALQVADRWHLLKNLSEHLTRLLEKHASDIRQLLAQDMPTAQVLPVPPAETTSLSRDTGNSSVIQQRSQTRHAKRLALYEQVHCLHQQGVTQKGIAEQLHLDRKTVRKYLAAATLPEHQPRPCRSGKLDPYKPYLLERWNQGCLNGAQLRREIQALGYTGGVTLVNAFFAHLRRSQGLPPRARTTHAIAENQPHPLTPKHLTWLILKRPAALKAEQATLVQKAAQLHPDLQAAISLCQQFAAMVRERGAEQLETWLEQVRQSGLAVLRRFVAGLKRDYLAVRAALSEPWSNGRVEGHINRLKFIKRQMYGRANFDLLRQRVLLAM